MTSIVGQVGGERAGAGSGGSAWSLAEVRGRASGLTVLGFFGLAWTGWGSSDLLGGAPQVAVVVAAALVSVSLASFGWRRYRRAAAVGSTATQRPDGAEGASGGGDVSGPARPDRDRAVERRFGWIVAVEFAGLGVIAAILGATGHPNAIPAVITIGVGIHFFPLARLFAVRIYWLSGAALCVLGLATLVLAPLTSTPTLWTALPGLGAAVVLYATCVQLLRELVAWAR
ncbi:hypothetical protein GCM10023322_74670 [Rugosimonospora acidiphila]|uniref:Uncharacterized protein n=1 Tax=Rugosimonospora acidiphila TaxID=556531 RepID=A0ABP9SQ92_9ACTN